MTIADVTQRWPESARIFAQQPFFAVQFAALGQRE